MNCWEWYSSVIAINGTSWVWDWQKNRNTELPSGIAKHCLNLGSWTLCSVSPVPVSKPTVPIRQAPPHNPNLVSYCNPQSCTQTIILQTYWRFSFCCVFIFFTLQPSVLDSINIIIIGIQPLGRSRQRPEFSQATGMALVRCILGKFLGVACHCFPPLFRRSHLSPPGASTYATTWEISAAEVGTVGENVVR